MSCLPCFSCAVFHLFWYNIVHEKILNNKSRPLVLATSMVRKKREHITPPRQDLFPILNLISDVCIGTGQTSVHIFFWVERNLCIQLWVWNPTIFWMYPWSASFRNQNAFVFGFFFFVCVLTKQLFAPLRYFGDIWNSRSDNSGWMMMMMIQFYSTVNCYAK